MSRHDRKWDPIKDRAFVAEVRRRLDESRLDALKIAAGPTVERLIFYFALGLVVSVAAASPGKSAIQIAIFAALLALVIVIGVASRPRRAPAVAILLRDYNDSRLYGILAHYAAYGNETEKEVADHRLRYVLRHVRPEYGELLAHEEVSGLNELLLTSDDNELCRDLIEVVERTRDLRLERQIGRMARADCPSGQSARVRATAEECLNRLERHRQELREQARLLRPAEETGDSTLLRPAGSDHESEELLLRPTGSGEGDG